MEKFQFLQLSTISTFNNPSLYHLFHGFGDIIVDKNIVLDFNLYVVSCYRYKVSVTYDVSNDQKEVLSLQNLHKNYILLVGVLWYKYHSYKIYFSTYTSLFSTGVLNYWCHALRKIQNIYYGL